MGANPLLQLLLQPGVPCHLLFHLRAELLHPVLQLPHVPEQHRLPWISSCHAATAIAVGDVAAAATDKSRAVALSTLRAALRAVLLNRGDHLAAAEGYKRPRFSAQIAKVQ